MKDKNCKKNLNKQDSRAESAGTHLQDKRCWGGLVLLVLLCIEFFLSKSSAVSLKCVGNDIKNFTDVFIAVEAAFIVGILTITVTMYVFLKSALDRSIEENRHIARAAGEFQKETTESALCSARESICLLALSLLCYALIYLKPKKIWYCLLAEGILIIIMLMHHVISTFRLWSRCIHLQRGLKETIERLLGKDNEQLGSDIKIALETYDERDNKEADECQTSRMMDKVFLMLGYWDKWDTDALDKAIDKNGGIFDWDSFKEDQCNEKEMGEVKTHGESLVKETEVDEFLSLFRRSEKLLLSGNAYGAENKTDVSSSFYAIGERESVLSPIVGNAEKNGIEGEELKGIRFADEEKCYALEHIKGFRTFLGFFDPSDHKSENSRVGNINYEKIKNSTSTIYKTLKDFADLILAYRASYNDNRLCIKDYQNAVVALYFFFLRSIGLYASASRIERFTMNGATLNFADFYSSYLDNISLYSSQFYHTVFVRSHISNAIFDVSQFDSVLFNKAIIENVSMNQSKFWDMSFQDAKITKTELSGCEFKSCKFDGMTCERVNFSESSFYNQKLDGVDFLASILSFVKFRASSIYACGFRNTVLQRWTINADAEDDQTKFVFKMKRCDFTDSIWDKMELKRADASESQFIRAAMPGVKFLDCMLEKSVFDGAMLSDAVFENCEGMQLCSFENTNLFSSMLRNCCIRQSFFSEANFAEATIISCDMYQSDFFDTIFRNTVITKTKFDESRLRDVTLNHADVSESSFQRSILDDTQFTSAKCVQCDFSMATMSECTFSCAEFHECRFNGNDLSSSSFYQTKIGGNTSFDMTDFNGSRFIEATFENTVFTNCDFSNCDFGKVFFHNCKFDTCCFESVSFSQCRGSKSVDVVGCYRERNNMVNTFSIEDMHLIYTMAV